MESLSMRPIDGPDEYLKAPSEAYVQTAVGWVTMQRSGITSPGYPDRAVYQVKPYYPEAFSKAFYVYEAGHFWPSEEWHEQCKADGRYGFEVSPPTRKARKSKRAA